jgi:hypothetical protein
MIPPTDDDRRTMNQKQRAAKRERAKRHTANQAERKANGYEPVHKRKQPKKPKES